jgi:excisionase family DNA binding protein
MQYMTVREIARALRLSEHTINRWCRLGLLKASRAGKAWRVAPADLTAFLEWKQKGENNPKGSTPVYAY